MRLLLGAHRSTSGGRHHAFDSGMAIGCQAIQIFTSSPRQWKAAEITGDELAAWEAARAESSVELVVAHDSYLINLAAPDDAIRAKSVTAFTKELERCLALGIPFVVSHPGAHLEASPEEGLARFAGELRAIYERRPELTAMTLLETTAGQGTSLGHRFEQIAWLIEAIDLPERIGVCVDTCHIHAAGYDLRDAAACRATIDELEAVIGLAQVKVWHLNDSKRELGSRVDRHEQIGEGEIGDAGFAALLADERLAGVPMLVETPDLELHGANLKRLRRLARTARGEPS